VLVLSFRGALIYFCFVHWAVHRKGNATD
jgi:hypothetical protein